MLNDGKRLNRAVSTRELLGSGIFGKLTVCPTCGAKSDQLKTPEDRSYYQLRCECQQKRVLDNARGSFDRYLAVWRAGMRTIGDLERINPKERDQGAYSAAWGQCRKSALSAKELSDCFNFALPTSLVEWGSRHTGFSWRVESQRLIS
jgi:hypothetical protein